MSFPCRGEHVRTYISGSRYAWWQKTTNRHTHTHTHTHTHRMLVVYTSLQQNRTPLQTINMASSQLRREVLRVYRQALCLARSWQAEETSQTAAERSYIREEARRLFRKNKYVSIVVVGSCGGGQTHTRGTKPLQGADNFGGADPCRGAENIGRRGAYIRLQRGTQTWGVDPCRGVRPQYNFYISFS